MKRKLLRCPCSSADMRLNTLPTCVCVCVCVCLPHGLAASAPLLWHLDLSKNKITTLGREVASFAALVELVYVCVCVCVCVVCGVC